LGGVAEKTRECMLVCEAAGYDIVIVETVGVGQSETAVAGMTDMFVLMQLPNAGDDLQAIKKGVMELADLIVINKSDIDTDAATRAQSFIQSALHLLGHHPSDESPHWQAEVMRLSALQGTGIEEFWEKVQRFMQLQNDGGRWVQRRQTQSLNWMNERIQSGLKEAFQQHPQVAAAMSHMQQQVLEGSMAASTAARQLLALASRTVD
jgi:LAO/AO transport system kinase